MSKLITVFGATGNQGRSVIDHILADPALSKEFKVRGITRDTSKPSAQELEKKGVEMKSADMNSPKSIDAAIAGSHTVFLVTNFWETMSMETEYTQGKNVANAVKEAGISHLIFSSLIHITEASSGTLQHVLHFDGKASIERYIRELGIPATFVMAGYFMSNFLQALKKGEDGVYTLAVPVTPKAQFPLIDIADIGKWVTVAMKKRDSLLGHQLYAAAGYYTAPQIIRDFKEATGQEAKYVEIEGETYKKFLPQAIAQEMLETHLLLESPGYYAGADIEPTLKLLEQKPKSWREYVASRDEWE